MTKDNYTKSLFILLLVVFVSSCRSITEEERMRRTTNDIISIIEENQFAAFRRSIGSGLLTIGKNDEMLFDDFTEFNALFGKYAGRKDIKVNITDLYNSMGQRIVDIPIKSATTESPDSTYHLNLFFGPPNIFPLNKITGYKLTRGNVVLEDFRKMEKPVRSGK